MKTYYKEHSITLKVGDIVTSYYNGIWKIIKIGECRLIRGYNSRYRAAPLVTLEKMYTRRHKKVKNKIIKICDITWCTKLSEEQVKLIEEFNNKFYKETYVNC